MVAGKESLIYFETLARRQSRIYPDACDYGVEMSEDELIWVRRNLVALMNIYQSDVEGTRGDASSKVEIWITVEKDEGVYTGTKLTVQYFKEQYRDHRKFICITFEGFVKPNHTFLR